VFSRLAAVVFVLGVVPGSLWLGGVLPLPDSRLDIVPYESRTIGAEEEWRDHVSAICVWERQQGRAFKKAFRRAWSPDDIESLFNAALRLSDESLAIFDRLDTPLSTGAKRERFGASSGRSERVSRTHAMPSAREGAEPFSGAFVASWRRMSKAAGCSQNSAWQVAT
jgi:hypothetical protein